MNFRAPFIYERGSFRLLNGLLLFPVGQVTRYSTLIHFSAYGIKRNISEREIFPLQVCAMTAQVAGGACRGACERA